MKVLETALGQVREDQNNIRLFMAQLLSSKEMSDSAIVMLRQVVENGGDTVRALFQTGAEYEKLGRFDKSVEAFELLLAIEPDHHPTLNYLGYMLADKGERLDEALVMIEKAVNADPDNGAYLDSYAWVLYKLGRYSEALAQIRKAAGRVPDDPTVVEHLGDIHAALGNAQEARDAWKQALAVDPDNETLKQKLRR
jgi:tetratricopeptide (TPR) repeat protein